MVTNRGFTHIWDHLNVVFKIRRMGYSMIIHRYTTEKRGWSQFPHSSHGRNLQEFWPHPLEGCLNTGYHKSWWFIMFLPMIYGYNWNILELFSPFPNTQLAIVCYCDPSWEFADQPTIANTPQQIKVLHGHIEPPGPPDIMALNLGDIHMGAWEHRRSGFFWEHWDIINVPFDPWFNGIL